MNNLGWKAHVKGMLRDIVSCQDFPEACETLGFLPAGEDVEAMEHAASHHRVENIHALLPDIYGHAATAGRLLCHLYHDGEEGEDAPLYTIVAQAGALAVVAHLVDTGRLEVVW